MKKKCPKCGSISESKFCITCGQNLTGNDIVKICPKCGEESSSKFCISCGTRLIEDVNVQIKDEPANTKEDNESQKHLAMKSA